MQSLHACRSQSVAWRTNFVHLKNACNFPMRIEPMRLMYFVQLSVWLATEPSGGYWMPLPSGSLRFRPVQIWNTVWNHERLWAQTRLSLFGQLRTVRRQYVGQMPQSAARDQWRMALQRQWNMLVSVCIGKLLDYYILLKRKCIRADPSVGSNVKK